MIMKLYSCFMPFLLVLMSLAPVHGAAAKVKVVTSIFPTYDFARQVGGELVEVTLLLPPGVEAHGFAPTPRDMVIISQADVFVYTGEAMEPWVADLLRGVDNKNLLVIDTSEGVLTHHGDEHKKDHDHHNNNNHYGGVDPHFWLDPLKAAAMVKTIAAAFAKADRVNQKKYQSWAKAYNVKLTKLDKDIGHSLSNCRLHTIISGGHFAFGHFCERYHLETVSAYKGFSPSAKPSPRAITRLIRAMKRLGSRVVFHEELIDPKVARIIGEETGARLLLLHGAHNTTKEERQRGETYLSIMRDNLVRLQQGLQCQ
jgi:zinc transport system substrate-binding protein